MDNGKKIKQIAEKFNIALIYVFGSQVEAGLDLLKGIPREINDPMTDIDIGVVFLNGLPEAKKKHILYSSIYSALHEIFMPYPLDLVLLQETHSVFQGEVVCGECIYFITKEFKDNYEEKVLMRAADFRPFLERYLDELLEEVW